MSQRSTVSLSLLALTSALAGLSMGGLVSPALAQSAVPNDAATGATDPYLLWLEGRGPYPGGVAPSPAPGSGPSAPPAAGDGAVTPRRPTPTPAPGPAMPERPVDRSPDRIEQTAVDPYPVADADYIEDPTVADDPYALAPTPVPTPTPRLARTNEVAPIRSVVRPVERASQATLPATGAIPLVRDPEAEARAEYEPTGLRLGSFQAFATSRSAIGSSSQDGTYWQQDGDVVLRSDWERHGLDVTLRGSARDSFDGDSGLLPSLGAAVNGRYDLTAVDRIGLSASYDWTREESDDADLAAGGKPSDVGTLSASLGYERDAGLIGVALKGAVDRTTYSEAEDRNNTLLTGTLRLSLDAGAVLEPFVEGAAFTRLYDQAASDGGDRDTVGGEVKGGFTIDADTITGEAALGYAVESADDGGDLAGVVGTAQLAWAATPLATVALRADTSFSPTSVEGSNGSVTHSADVTATYALRPALLINAGASLSWQDFEGIDREVTTTVVRAGAAWRLNRTVELGLTASHEIVQSTEAGGDSTDTRVEASVTLRR